MASPKRLITLGVICSIAIMPLYATNIFAEGIPEVIKSLNQIKKTLDDQVIPKLDQCTQCTECPKCTAGVPKTGQTATYRAGDDGALQKGISWPIPRFTDYGNGTVKDNLTGLIWLKNANCFGGNTWANALIACNRMQNGGCGLSDDSVTGDWRLPNIKELQSLIHYGVHDPALPDTSGTSKWSEGNPFTGVQCDATNCDNGYYLSSSEVAGSGEVYYLYLGGGFVYEVSLSHSGYFVWCVRGGN